MAHPVETVGPDPGTGLRGAGDVGKRNEGIPKPRPRVRGNVSIKKSCPLRPPTLGRKLRPTPKHLKANV
jgi:hypothetical protein